MIPVPSTATVLVSTSIIARLPARRGGANSG